MKHAPKIAALTLTMSLLGASASSAMAAEHDTTWQKNHPRREQVNERLVIQNKRIKTEVKEADLSKSQAASLHKDDRQIRQEERLMARTAATSPSRNRKRSTGKRTRSASKSVTKLVQAGRPVCDGGRCSPIAFQH